MAGPSSPSIESAESRRRAASGLGRASAADADAGSALPAPAAQGAGVDAHAQASAPSVLAAPGAGVDAHAQASAPSVLAAQGAGVDAHAQVASAPPASAAPGAGAARADANAAPAARPAGLPAVRPGSGAMFDRIARRYDLLNRVLSLGLDQRWRRLTVAALQLQPGHRVLDLATGTGDLALAMLSGCPGASVVGLDPSPQMLAHARAKAIRRGVRVEMNAAGGPGGLALGVGEAEHLPFADRSFDAVAIAFGLRNVPDREGALAEMARVTRPGGRIAILELGEPRGPVLGRLARLHIHVLVPRLGALLSGAREYRYLEKSIAAFPPPDVVAAMMERSGVEPLEARPLTLGVCHLFVGRVRAEGAPC
jgi:demethylmenaquinone methyltransferase / 2-methoxy-6-polyprenyl-1,4-benzoquinol methylase